MLDEVLWVEKYRPRSIDETILPKALKENLQAFVDRREIPNLLLSGPAGIGKTTVARAMLEEIEADYIVINGSMNGNIDTLRNEIMNFATSMSFTGQRKFVILDEADYLNCLEENEKILTVNNETISLKNMEDNKIYQVLSFNTETALFEKDTAQVVNRTTKMVYDVELENGVICRMTDDHPIICKDFNGNIVQRTIKQGLDGYEVLVHENLNNL